MNIFIHEDFMKGLRSRIRRRQLIGVGLFLIAFVASFAALSQETQFLIFLAYPLLLIGVVFWFSARNADARLNAVQADALINGEVKGLSNKYSLHHYPRIGDVWIPHLFIMPAGVLVLDSNDSLGPVTCNGNEKGDHWHAPAGIQARIISLIDKVMGDRPQLDNPSLDLDRMVTAVRAMLDSIGKPQVPVKGLVLFTRNPEIEINGCAYGATPVNELRLALHDLEQSMGEDREGSPNVRVILTSEDRRKINNILAPVSIPASAKPEKPTRPASVKR